MTRQAGVVSGLTLVSRLTGLARTMVFTTLFGAGSVADAFVIAFTIPNVFRRFLAEGALSVAFVPVFTDYKTNRGIDELRRLYNVTFSLFSVVLLLFCGICMLISPLLVKLFAPGFDSEIFDLAVYLNRLMFPFLFFIGLTSLLVGILNTHNHFAAPAAGPVLLNLGIIGVTLALYRLTDPPITAMAVGVLAGGFLQLLLQLPFVRARGIRLRFDFRAKHPAVGRMLRLMGPAAFGLAVYQVNILVSRALASLLPKGSVTYIYVSDRLLELPLGVFAVAVATVALPSLSRHASQGNRAELKETLRFALKLTMLVCIPAMAWLAVCRLPMISTMFQRGEFTHADALATSQVFLAASAGIWAVAGIRNLVPVFYALGDIKTPVKIALVSFLLNAAIGVCLMWPMGAAGLTTANSISAAAYFAMLWLFLRRKIGPLGIGDVWNSVWRVGLASLAAGAAAWPFARLGIWTADGALGAKLLHLGLAGLSGLAAFLLLAWLLRIRELEALLRRLRRRK